MAKPEPTIAGPRQAPRVFIRAACNQSDTDIAINRPLKDLLFVLSSGCYPETRLEMELLEISNNTVPTPRDKPVGTGTIPGFGRGKVPCAHAFMIQARATSSVGAC